MRVLGEYKGTVQAVERTLRILECFNKEKSELDLGDIAKMTALSKSTVFRLLATLAQFGYIKQDSYTQKYSLGFKFFHLSAVLMSNMNLRKTSLPFMKELSEEISETISLNIVEGTERVCIEVIESSEDIRHIVRVGQRNKIHEGSSGQLMLAYLPEVERRSVIEEIVQSGLLPVQRSRFEKELVKIREQGYTMVCDSTMKSAFSIASAIVDHVYESRIKGAFSIASPIFDYTGKLTGCITVAGPIQRLNEDRLPFLIRQVIATAQKISQALGFSEIINH